MTAALHSNYWLDQDIFNDDIPKGTSKDTATDLATIARFAAVRRAIANFVSILSGKNVPVEFSSGKNSYTDGERVIIAAEDDPEKFDVMVGLALHEASHILLTDFEFIRQLQPHKDQYAGSCVPGAYWCGQILAQDIARVVFPHELASLFPPRSQSGPQYDYTADIKYCRYVSQAFNDVHMLMNILEDRRIDKYVYTNAGGYRPYYNALYNKYFFTKEIGKNLKFNPAWRELTVENYINRLLFSFHPDSNPDAMPYLREMINYMDLANIDRIAPVKEDTPAWKATPSFQNTPMLWQVACNLYMMILKVVGMSVTQKETPQGFNPQPSDEKQGNPLIDQLTGNPGKMDNLPNLDIPSGMQLTPQPVEKDTKGKGKKQVEVEGKYNSKKAEKELKEAKKVMDGDIKKKKMTKQTQAAVTALEEAAGEMVDISGHGIPKANCMITRRLTERLMEQDWFIFGNRWVSDSTLRAIAAGKRMGQILHNRLQVRNDPMFTKQTRLPHGGMDRRLLAQLGMDITNVFQKTRVDQHRPAMLHLSLDASGSMSGNKWNKVQTVAVALAYIGSKLRNVDTVISIRGGNDLPIVAVVYDSRKDQFNKFCNLFAKIGPAGGTPEGLCYKATMDLITECAATHDTYFINFSDGEPSFYVMSNAGLTASRGSYGTSYGGDLAYKHTRQMVNMMRDQNVKVLSYFITDTGRTYTEPTNTQVAFKKMYGEDAVFVNVQNAGEVLTTMNRLLRERGT